MSNNIAQKSQAGTRHVEILDGEPLTIRRPLTLLKGRAYVATWLPARVTTSQSGKTQTHLGRSLLIVRDDGHTFGEGGDKSLADLEVEICLPETPRLDKLWSTAGMRAYQTGTRVDPVNVFRRLTDLVDRFMAFDRSLADQSTMCELIACYILSTWFLDAFTVIGFLWSNGDRGTAKTKLLNVVVESSYLGHLTQPSSSFATMRDLADYGATLAFDDVENLANPQQFDQDKRALLLASNRKGNTITVKESRPNNQWQTRYVNTFCPRLFSAINVPDPVLASRAIVIPLIRTNDPAKANADPVNYALWPHDRRTLIDDLWGLALANLAKLPTYEERVNQQAPLVGRTLEPWRAVLAVALWLQDKGVEGLEQRMVTLAVKYQEERPSLETGDLTTLVIRALFRCMGTSVSSVSSITSISSERKQRRLTTAEITQTVHQIMQEEDIELTEEVTPKRVGRKLTSLRITKDPDTSIRAWRVSLADLISLAVAYGLTAPPSLSNAGNAGNAGNACSPLVQVSISTASVPVEQEQSLLSQETSG